MYRAETQLGHFWLAGLISPSWLPENHFQSWCVRATFSPSCWNLFPSIATAGKRGFYAYVISYKNEYFHVDFKTIRFNIIQEQAKKDLHKNVEFKYNILHRLLCNSISYANIDKRSPRQNPIYDISWLISPYSIEYLY